jgi:arylsulfatase A-like enzyme
LDRLFGEIVDFVQSIGELNNTHVIISSDHGEMLGDHGDIGKTMPWQGSVSVPLLWFGEGVPKNRLVHTPVATLDIGATILQLAGVAKAPGMTSHSLMPLFQAPAANQPSAPRAPSGASSGASSGAYRSFVSSGLQQAADPAQASWNWRLVVQQLQNGSIFK